MSGIPRPYLVPSTDPLPRPYRLYAPTLRFAEKLYGPSELSAPADYYHVYSETDTLATVYSASVAIVEAGLVLGHLRLVSPCDSSAGVTFTVDQDGCVVAVVNQENPRLVAPTALGWLMILHREIRAKAIEFLSGPTHRFMYNQETLWTAAALNPIESFPQRARLIYQGMKSHLDNVTYREVRWLLLLLAPPPIARSLRC